MMHHAFTARNVAKYVVMAAVQQKTAELTEDAIEDYVGFEEDNMFVGLGSNVVGWYVASKLKPYTDKMVDKTADFVTAKREARAEKKNTEKE